MPNFKIQPITYAHLFDLRVILAKGREERSHTLRSAQGGDQLWEAQA
jgi:hypothetical protein